MTGAATVIAILALILGVTLVGASATKSWARALGPVGAVFILLAGLVLGAITPLTPKIQEWTSMIPMPVLPT